MPSNLLGKKSWNVYNTDNVERVRRDEAAAKASEEAEEQRIQEIDAERRLAILRGEVPPLLESTLTTTNEQSKQSQSHSSQRHGPGSRYKKERKRLGEDDTDFELRIATERANTSVKALSKSEVSTSSAPIFDQSGHIDLFGNDRSRAHAERNAEAEKETQTKKREYEDQYTMRFSNAAGKTGALNPWYSQGNMVSTEPTLKDVFGNEDPARKWRSTLRMTSNDPLAMMKSGAAKVRELKQERSKFQDEREKELKQLRKDDRRRERGERKHRRSRSPTSRRDNNKSRERERERRRPRSRSKERDSRRRDRGHERPRRSASPDRHRPT